MQPLPSLISCTMPIIQYYYFRVVLAMTCLFQYPPPSIKSRLSQLPKMLNPTQKKPLTVRILSLPSFRCPMPFKEMETPVLCCPVLTYPSVRSYAIRDSAVCPSMMMNAPCYVCVSVVTEYGNEKFGRNAVCCLAVLCHGKCVKMRGEGVFAGVCVMVI